MKRMLSVVMFAAALAACAPAPLRGPTVTGERPLQPEGASTQTRKPGWVTRTQAVAAAHPMAADAGLRMLKEGGSAVDAAIAAQMVLTLVEPQSSGIGGGSFLLHWNGREVEAFDGRETAPALADERLFLDAGGKPMAFHAAAVGGRAVGVPGTLRMLELAHRQHGRLPWAQLFQPAIALADDGFPVGARLHALLTNEAHLKQDPAAAAYFYQADGTPRRVGELLRNPELAAVFRRIAAEGPRALHEGEIAQAIVDKVQKHPGNPGRLSLADLAAYQPRKREPLCHDLHAGGKDWHVCGFPPPSSGAIAIGQILGMLSLTPATAMPLKDGLPSADWLHFYTEAARLAFADRAQWVADPDFVQPPAGRWTSLLDPPYLAQRAALIGTASMQVASPGSPSGTRASFAPMPEQPEYGTSHISIVDNQGNALAMTSSIEAQFGARQMVSGFLLNNELTDFSFEPADAQGRPVANRVQPGKRPRSSMAPTLVFDKAGNQLVMTAGSPGGAVIIHHTAKTLYGVFHWGLNPQQAIDLPNFGSNNGPTFVESERFPAATLQALRARGAVVLEQVLPSGVQAIVRTPGAWFGGADSRREGTVAGD